MILFFQKMTFSILILTIGVPGCGKTKWVEEYMKSHPLTYVVSTDHIRKELTGTEIVSDPSENEGIHEEAIKRVKHILEIPSKSYCLGPEIIIDSTNTNVYEWLRYRKLNPSIMIAKVFNIPPEEAIRRQEGRERKVPNEVIKNKWEEFQHDKQYLNQIFNMIWE